jgi:two-component system, OmpR family, sensor histidine kinase KdpD
MSRRLGYLTASLLVRPLLAVVAITLTTAGLFLLRPSLSTPVVALLFLLPVGLSTALWGLVPGILASLCAFLAFNYFFITPYYTLFVHQTQDVLALIVFLVVAIAVSEMVGRAQASLAQAQARERESTQLYELSTALAGLRDAEAIARVLAERVRDSFEAQRVEVEVQAGDEGSRAVAGASEADTAAGSPPHATAGLATVRGSLGAIRLWRDDLPLTPPEERLLNTFASQGALAFEHALLAQAETHAKVLEESDRLKSALLSSVSHELRTPLATIKAAVSGLGSGEVDWEAQARQDLLAVVEEEVDHLNRLVGNLLDMSRIEAGALRPQLQWGLLAEIVGDTLSRMRRVVERHRLQVDIPEDLPLAPLDHALMEQVFTNLIGNSVKYAPPGSAIRLEASAPNDATLLVRISNKGPQIPAEHLEHIFDKFHRVTEADRVTGTGLGLSICKGIVEAHGGHIWAENLPDGLAFNFTLPLTWDGARPPQPPQEPEAA